MQDELRDLFGIDVEITVSPQLLGSNVDVRIHLVEYDPPLEALWDPSVVPDQLPDGTSRATYDAAVQNLRRGGASDEEIERWRVARQRLINVIDSNDLDPMTVTTTNPNSGLALAGIVRYRNDYYINPYTWSNRHGQPLYLPSPASRRLGPTFSVLHDSEHELGCMAGTRRRCRDTRANVGAGVPYETHTVDDVNLHTDMIPQVGHRVGYSQAVRHSGVTRSFEFPTTSELHRGSKIPDMGDFPTPSSTEAPG